jgi:pyridoxamine 5'-phosphate oxidase
MSDVPAVHPGGLTQDELGRDPIARFVAWLEEANEARIPFAEAVALATADAQGRPAVRHVLLKGVDERGFTFFTNHESRKGRHVAENPNAAMAFLWRELDRQVCVTGSVSAIAREESASYFRTRPREARLGAWASKQSRPVASREDLERAFAETAARFPDEVPLPPHWGGFRLLPETIEFWKGREHRLHDRFRYTRADDGWDLERLWP